MGSISKPPDGGWGWVIVVCGFINHVFTVGLMMSLSVFYVSWLDQFGESKGTTSWIMSIGVACMFGLCPIPASLAAKFGFRTVAVIGGLLTSFGLILSTFATSVSYLVVSIGLITGIGCCFCYLPAVATVAMYFDLRRSLAMGLNTAGTGIGAFALAPLLNHLEEMYGWRGALLLLSGFTLHMCITGMLMRSLETKTVDEIVGDSLESDTEKQRKENHEGLAIESSVTDLAKTPLLNVMNANGTNSENHSLPQDPMIPSVSEREDNTRVHEMNHGEIDLEEQCYEMDEDLSSSLFRQINNVDHNLHASEGNLNKLSSLASKKHHSYSLQSLDVRAITKSIQNIDLAVLASVPSLVNEKERLEVGIIHHSSVSINENSAGIQEDSEMSMCKWPLVSTILSSRTVKENIELLSDKAHVAFCISNFITNLSFIAPVVFMVDRAVYQGISKSVGAILVSANGIGNVAGRIIFGYVADRFPNRHIHMYISALTVCGIGTMLSDFCGNAAVLHAAYAAFFGFLMGKYTVLAPIVSVDLMGVAVFATAFGQTLFCMGSATVIGPPLAGWLFDWTKSYLLSYLAIGLFFVISGIMLLPLLCRSNKTPSTPIPKK